MTCALSFYPSLFPKLDFRGEGGVTISVKVVRDKCIKQKH